MLIDLSNDLDKKVDEVSVLMNLNKEELVNRAVKVFIDDIEKMLKLKKEFQNWDALSDESLINFEGSL
jgi:hypothetical protein